MATTTTTVVINQKQPNACRAAIPAMHIAAAVVCCILNVFLPGIGTIVAGFSVFCCGNVGQSGAGKVGTMCLNFWIGLLQLGTVWFFLLGWIWSIMWGAAFIGMSADYHSDDTTTTVVTTTAAPAPMVVTQPVPVVAAAPVAVAAQPAPVAVAQPSQPPPAYDQNPQQQQALPEKTSVPGEAQ